MKCYNNQRYFLLGNKLSIQFKLSVFTGNKFCLFNLLAFIGILIPLYASAQTISSYMNPVIPGDHPDATLTRSGNDFYTTGSSFNVTPVIYHSTDLVHWEAVAQPVKASWSNYGDRPGGGCWGGHMVYHHDKYWHYFSRANTMYFVTANDPKGLWSEPVKVSNPPELPYGLGYDNSIFIDDNGKWYLVVKNGQPNGGIVELGTDGQPTGVVYDLNWLNPEPDFPYSWAEGPVIWKYKGYYYYSFARDLGGGQKVMRSDTLTANEEDWEMLGDFFDEDDPQKSGALFTSPNHASPVVMLDDSTHWIIHPLYAKGEWRGQGRQGLMNQVHYDENLKPVADYPVNRSFTAPALYSSGIPFMVPKSDFFASDNLNPEWSFLGYTPDNKWSLTDRPGWLRLSPKDNGKTTTIIKNDGEHNYSLITRFKFDPQSVDDQAGLWIMRGDETSSVKLYSTINEFNRKVIIFNFDDKSYQLDNTLGNILWLKIIRVNHSISGYVSGNGWEWEQVGSEFDVSSIDSYSDFSTFTGTRQGLFVLGKEAFFDMYIYRDAYSPILTECPANQYGTTPTTKTDGIFQLDSIHNNDWVLYAGVEFGSNDYLKSTKALEVTASCAGSGGIVEVWLDSLSTGTKVAECEITNTGDWNTFNTFTVPVDPITGCRDVYLLFKGAEGERLFKLKWIKFVADNAPEFIKANLNDDDTLLLALSQSVLEPTLPSGLSIKANGTVDIPISDIELNESDSSLLIIKLSTLITNTDELTISYDTGTIQNKMGLSLLPFEDKIVNNQLPGAIPIIKLVETKHEGDTVWLYLSKKMNSPAAYAENFTINVEDNNNITVSSATLVKFDSSVIIFIPENRIYYEDQVSLTYNGSTLEANNGGVLATFSEMDIRNTADGYPPQVVSTSLAKYGKSYAYINVTFDKLLMEVDDQKDYFIITLNDVPASIQGLVIEHDSIRFRITPNIQYGDVVKLSYSGGDIKSKYNGKLEDINDYEIQNTVPLSVLLPGNSNSELRVYPNPAHSEISLEGEFPITSLTIYSMAGKQLIYQEFNQEQQILRMPVNLEAGAYVFAVRNNKYRESIKVLIRQ